MSNEKIVSSVNFPKLKLTVIKKLGHCYHNYEVGDEFILEDFTHPPKNFCTGLVKSAFPCLYGLTFGAEFKFMQNTKSITVTCPDNAKLSFKIEVLDSQDKVVISPQKEKPKGPSPKILEVEVDEVCGHCFFGYKKGDRFQVTGLKTPDGFCGAAYSILFPVLFALNFGASFSFEENPLCKTGITCPDGGNIRFKVRRINNKDLL
ncbi:MAG: TIGR04076 family protein [Candidatus Omnitrophica bacterium]|nr:TIGR04076 family protein [Candidatus Omnitrophota bacterium]MBU0896740.1 TIGR04076 family protein [Candidatus Omnitrophota bacterium]MBU1134780.1 TIGR04076 family protein [Candidatus Omnitrophota bacterium]MBU1366887.1 TIGR04076 family protein [Candidatus Omnitrophota bacterium]MBU1523991.1 TIGR04076 family protein [Candidatus Omnitrophota bacterium]